MRMNEYEVPWRYKQKQRRVKEDRSQKYMKDINKNKKNNKKIKMINLPWRYKQKQPCLKCIWMMKAFDRYIFKRIKCRKDFTKKEITESLLYYPNSFTNSLVYLASKSSKGTKF